MSIRSTVERAEAARRHGPLAMIVVLVVMAGSAVGLWSAWRAFGHHGAGGAVPVIAADKRPVKVAPADPGGMRVPDQAISVLNPKRGGEPRVEQLLPPPETPLPRPVPVQQAASDTPSVAPLAAPAVPREPSAPVAAPVAEPASPAVVAAMTAPPAPAAPPPAVASQAAAASTFSYRLQVGAVRSAEAAQQEWARLKRQEPDLLGKLEMTPSRSDQGARGVFYRIVAGPISDEGAAQRTCDTLKQRKVGCILVKP
jgi:hypothetical protein